MKRYFGILAALLMVACGGDDSDDLTLIENINSTKIKLTTDAENVEYENVKLTFTNISTKEETVANYNEPFSLLGGIYDVQVKATGKINGQSFELYGAANSITVTDGEPEFDVKLYLLDTQTRDLLIEEIFFTGTLYPTGKQYHGDCYVKLYNNTADTLYADRIAFVESQFLSTQKFNYTPDIQEDTMTVQAIYVVPGSGKEHPVLPGKSFIICDIAIDHRATNENSFDLSKADFEWYDESTSPSNQDIDNLEVANLDKWYCYTLSIFVLHNRGFRSYAIARIPEGLTAEKYLEEYKYDYSYVMSLPAGDFPMSSYKLPNAWIVDGVNCSVEAERQWNVLPPKIDAGWTHCGSKDGDATRYFKSVRRKAIAIDANGNRVLQDTNNSTNDFNGECVPSLVEEQQSAIDANGTKAQKVTLDGVKPKE